MYFFTSCLKNCAEASLFYTKWMEWMNSYWTISLIISILHLLTIYVLQVYMSNRKPIEIKNLLFTWNSIFAMFSFLGAIILGSQLFYDIYSNGFQYSVCVSKLVVDGITGFWITAIIITKPFQLLELTFIVLRKRRLTFLRVYHHVTTLIFVWYCFKDQLSAARLYFWMYLVEQSITYTYYTFRVTGNKCCKWIPIAVTLFRVIQMLAGCYIAFTAYRIRLKHIQCWQTLENVYVSFIYSFINLLLFGYSFCKSYCKSERMCKQTLRRSYIIMRLNLVLKFTWYDDRRNIDTKKNNIVKV